MIFVVVLGIFFPAHAQKPLRPLEPVSASRQGGDSLPAPLPSSVETKRSRNAWDCLLEPDLVVSVGSPVDGVIQEVLVDRGDEVRKGQVVARLQAGVESAAVELTKSHIEFGRRKVARNEVLYEKQLISAQDKDDMETEVRLREQELKRDLENLKLRTIISPLDGIVVERRLTRGDLVRTDRSVVLRLAKIDPLNVEVIAPSEYYGTARVGMTGIVSMQPMLPGTYKATVVVVDKLIDAASGTFGVRLQMPNPGNKIPAGLKCSVRFAK